MKSFTLRRQVLLGIVVVLCFCYYKEKSIYLKSKDAILNLNSQEYGYSSDMHEEKKSEFDEQDSGFDVTLVSQASLNRWGFMQQIARNWKGPISIVYYIQEGERSELLELKRNSSLRSNIIVDYVIQTDMNLYPTNYLRNRAIANVRTTHFYLSDMDIWPAPSTYSALLALPKSLLANERTAIIIPAFQIYMMSCSSFSQCELTYRAYYPQTKQLLRQCMKEGRCKTFRPKEWLHISYLTCAKSPSQHDYYTSDWFYAMSDYTPVTCFKSDTQEPYVMVRKTAHTPSFDERFVNYAYNKVQWIEHLRYVGYAFYVLTNGYSVDIPHPSSAFRKQFFASISRDRIFPMKDVYDVFVEELHNTTQDQSVVHLCKNARINPRRVYFASDLKRKSQKSQKS